MIKVLKFFVCKTPLNAENFFNKIMMSPGFVTSIVSLLSQIVSTNPNWYFNVYIYPLHSSENHCVSPKIYTYKPHHKSDGLHLTINGEPIFRPAGVCLAYQPGSSVMYACQNATTIHGEIYDSNEYCEGAPDSSGNLVEALMDQEVQDSLNIEFDNFNVTCCTGNPCDAFIQRLYNATSGCSTNISSPDIKYLDGAFTIGFCDAASGTDLFNAKYTSCNNGVVTFNAYQHEDDTCTGTPLFPNDAIFSDGLCDGTYIYGVTCATAIDTCNRTQFPTEQSLSPSNSPSIAPTASPSFAPSDAPSNSPSEAPSLSPSLSPSFSPIIAPSVAPSFLPTTAPSIAPSVAPTACIDYDENYNSNDGMDSYYSVNMSIFDEYYVEYIDDIHVIEDCAEINDTLCNVVCPSDGVCGSAEITINPIQFNAFNLLCESCLSTVITASLTKETSFSLHCYGEYSCQDAIINIINNYDDNPLSVNITCYNDYSCNNLLIKTDNSDNAIITLNMYEYSNNIQIKHENYLDHVQIICGLEYDYHYIRYPIDDPLDEKLLLSRAAGEYDSKKLPCQDITIVNECQYQYQISANLVFNDLIEASCYWIDVNQLFDTYCEPFTNDEMLISNQDLSILITVLGLTFVILMIVVAVFLYKRKQRRKQKKAKTMTVRNPLIIPIAIGFYDDDPIDPEIDGDLSDLSGVRIDIDNIVKLFGVNGLNYEISPNYYLDNINTYKAQWTEQELIQFLRQQATALEYNLVNEEDNKYDGLIVMISCHGIEGYILTSDYKKISKSAVHRIFSGTLELYLCI